MSDNRVKLRPGRFMNHVIIIIIIIIGMEIREEICWTTYYPAWSNTRVI